MLKFLFLFFVSFITSFFLIRFIKHNMRGRDWAYPALLASFPFFYFLFALWINDKNALKNEFIAAVVFFIIVGLYFRYRTLWAEYLLIAGFFLHGIYDLSHDMFFINMGVPSWWGVFCGLIDVFIGLYLIFHLKKQGAIIQSDKFIGSD